MQLKLFAYPNEVFLATLLYSSFLATLSLLKFFGYPIK